MRHLPVGFILTASLVLSVGHYLDDQYHESK